MNSATQATLSLQLGFADGSIGSVNYFANGSKAFPKERLEVFTSGRVLRWPDNPSHRGKKRNTR